ncbi:hypothetical protein MHYMCMPASI_00019 [Hyalomma marginatum]|uniref:Uncharacterized protein n=1 Tax=Hyalomma marginatum TaxID=34627 RepID=A0A8S4BV80_9ACAR|nr:hypothetical protein MHYMCMPASI_00019 [Hyalomma marginatum]
MKNLFSTLSVELNSIKYKKDKKENGTAYTKLKGANAKVSNTPLKVAHIILNE